MKKDVFTNPNSEMSSTKIIRWLTFVVGIVLFIAIVIIATIAKLNSNTDFTPAFYTFVGGVITLLIGVTITAYAHLKSLNNRKGDKHDP